MANTATSVLSVAASELGKSDGTKYGRYYVSLGNNKYYQAKGVPWCAMFVTWVFAQAGAKCVGIPGAYCPDIYHTALAAKRTVSARNAKAGDVILFDWDGGNPDHVGIVEKNYGTYLQTIEGNVSGKVMRRTRAYSTVKACIRPNYSVSVNKEEDVYGFAQVKNGSSGNHVKLCQAALNIRMKAGLIVDGACGPVTVAAIKKWQSKVGLYQDGICGAKTWPTLLGK